VAKKRHVIGAIAVTLPILLALSACAPGGSTAGTTTHSTVSKDITSKPVTLNMLDFWQGGESKWVDEAIAGFRKQHPNVTIKRTVQDWGQVMNTLNLRLADANGPDIATVNNGWQSMGTLAQGGRILNLDAYSDLYGWKKSIPATMLRQLEFTSNGKEMGTGSLYATPTARSSLIGLYYNTTVLQSLHIAVPKTLGDLEKACEKIKAAGKVPFAFGSVEKDSATAMLFSVQDLYGSAKNIGDFVYSAGHIPMTKTGITQAATTIKKWADNGWFTPNYQGVAYADALDKFMHGDGAFRFEYTGAIPFTDAQKQTYGYLQLPQVDGSGVVGTGSASGVMSISSKSKNPDVAAAFLNYLTNKQTAQLAVDHGYLPLLHSDLKKPAGNAELATEITGQQSLDANNGYVPYFDWSTPTMLDTMGTQMQLLLAGRATPQQLTEAGQKDYDAFQATRK
jgi:raffinose/stachyose/melibiose transport system substrate-binding protein